MFTYLFTIGIDTGVHAGKGRRGIVVAGFEEVHAVFHGRLAARLREAADA